MQTTCPDGLFQGDRPLQISTQIAMNMIAADLRQGLEDKGKTQRGASVAVTNRVQRASFTATPVDELLKVVNQNLPGATVERLTCDLNQLVRFWGMPLSANDRTFLHGIDALRVSFPPTLHEWVSIKVHQAWGAAGAARASPGRASVVSSVVDGLEDLSVGQLAYVGTRLIGPDATPGFLQQVAALISEERSGSRRASAEGERWELPAPAQGRRQ